MLYALPMLYKVLSYLFPTSSIYRYTPRPWHLFYAVLLLGVGTVTFGQGWLLFGASCSLFGFLLGLTILIGMSWDKSIEYWQTIQYIWEAAIKIKDATTRYELLKSMGYNVLPQSVEVVETRRDEKGIFLGMSLKKLPVSPAIMQTIADKVLGEYITKGTVEFDFTEDRFASFVPKIRKVKKYLKEESLIATKHKSNPRIGYRWTKKGIEALRGYASEGVKIELKRKEEKEAE